jgi:uncharacterized protein (UPF0548 family)
MPAPTRSNRPLLPAMTVGRAEPALGRWLRRAEALEFNYANVGASRTQTTPPGNDTVTESAVVGAGLAQFSLLADGIRSWQIQRRSGLQVAAESPAREGVNVALAQRFGPAAIVFACRVVWTIEEPNRNGFAYGSLPGHPEAGEEAFLAELEPDGAVRFHVVGFTSPGTVATAAGRPLARALTRRALRGYLRAARDIVSP